MAINDKRRIKQDRKLAWDKAEPIRRAHIAAICALVGCEELPDMDTVKIDMKSFEQECTAEDKEHLKEIKERNVLAHRLFQRMRTEVRKIRNRRKSDTIGNYKTSQAYRSSNVFSRLINAHVREKTAYDRVVSPLNVWTSPSGPYGQQARWDFYIPESWAYKMDRIGLCRVDDLGLIAVDVLSREVENGITVGDVVGIEVPVGDADYTNLCPMLVYSYACIETEKAFLSATGMTRQDAIDSLNARLSEAFVAEAGGRRYG